MTLARTPTPSDQERLATVIPLVSPSVGSDDDERARAEDLLRRLAGPGGADLPADLGRSTARIEALLAHPPAALDSVEVEPTVALNAATRILAAAGTAVELITDEVEVLGDALSTDLSSLPLDKIVCIADAVLGLSMAPRAAASWGEPSAAAAAEVVLQVAAQDLRDAAQKHERLYERFTEGIWHVPVPLLCAARRRWRLVARMQVRRELRAASRNGRVGALAAAVTEVLDVHETRDRLEAVAPLLSHHLEQLDRGPLSDVDAAIDALNAVRLLQSALGDLLDDDRLRQLLLADAFRSPDVTGPAVNVCNAIRAWTADVEAMGGAGAQALDLATLARWTEECTGLVPALRAGQEAAGRIDALVPTLRTLVEILVVRERVAELALRAERLSARRHAGSAS